MTLYVDGNCPLAVRRSHAPLYNTSAVRRFSGRVLAASSAAAMRELLRVCDVDAAEYITIVVMFVYSTNLSERKFPHTRES